MTVCNRSHSNDVAESRPHRWSMTKCGARAKMCTTFGSENCLSGSDSRDLHLVPAAKDKLSIKI